MPRHYLSEINTTKRTAICSVCGPTTIRSRGPRWGCKTVANRNKHYKGEDRRRWWRKHVGDSCERCGFIPEDPCQLDVHHRDGTHSNSSVSNLGTLCANCHRVVHYRPNLNTTNVVPKIG